MAKEIIAGISVSGKLAHLAVFEVRETDTKLIHIEEFTNTSGDELWFLSRVLNPNSRLLKKITKVSVALDSASIVLHRFPMDITLTQAEQNEHVHWELSNFITDYQAKDYVYDLHILRLNAREQVADLLVVAVKRNKIYKIQEALAAKKLELHIADTTYFGAEQSLLLNYPEIKGKTVGLIVAEEHHLDVGIENNGRLVKYGYGLTSSADLIKKILHQQIQDITLSEIYCCGPKMTPEIVHLLKNSFETHIQYLDPFRRLIAATSIENINSFDGRKHLFAACTGVALRKR